MTLEQELAEVEDRIKTEISAHLWKTEPLFQRRAKLLAKINETNNGC